MARSASTAWVSPAGAARAGTRRAARGLDRAGPGARAQQDKGAPFGPQHTRCAPLGCAFPYAAYSMPASWLHGRLHQLFVPAAALNSFLCTGLACYSRWVLGQW